MACLRLTCLGSGFDFGAGIGQCGLRELATASAPLTVASTANELFSAKELTLGLGLLSGLSIEVKALAEARLGWRA